MERLSVLSLPFFSPSFGPLGMSSGASISGMPLSRHQIEQAKWGESRELRVWRVLHGGHPRICCDSARLSERPLVLRLLSRQSGRTEGYMEDAGEEAPLPRSARAVRCSGGDACLPA